MTELRPDPTLSTTQVGELFRVHPSTVKRWCDRGELSFGRTGGGHRRIHLSDALRLSASQGNRLALTRFGVDAGAVWLAERGTADDRDLTAAWKLTERWLADREFERIRDLVVHLGTRHPHLLPDVLDSVAREVMRHVGREWEEGRLGVGGEHLASELILEGLFELRRSRTSTGSTAPEGAVALVGCAEGERHALGAHAVRLVLEARGWEVRFLGADVPLDVWADLQKGYGARLACISFSSLRAPAELQRVLERLSGAYDPDRPYSVVFGGEAVARSRSGGLRPGGVDPDSPTGRARGSGPGTLEARAFPGTLAFTEWLAEKGW